MPEVYNKPIPNKIILRIDTLDCLRSLLGDECYMYRDFLYAILAGEDPVYDVNKLLASFYRKYPKFTEYVNDKYFYGNDSESMVDKVLKPLREKVNEYRAERVNYITGVGGKYLIQTHDFLYFAFMPYAKLPELEGTLIC